MSSYTWDYEAQMAKISGYLPLSLPSSMAFDHDRNKLWWIDQTTIYMADFNTNEIFTNNLSENIVGLTCISVISENGLVIVGAFKQLLACILIVDKNNINILESIDIQDSNIINQN